jgi:protein pelota
MRLLRRAIERDGQGEVMLLPEQEEDMWHAFNLIAVGDRLKASAIRYGPREVVVVLLIL